MRAPAFWQSGGWPVALLAPFEGLTARATAARVARPGWRAPVPVLCVGNATVGGTGKTPLCLDILVRLRARGVAAHALTRGHGGSSRGVRRVDPSRDEAGAVGDEARLLASVAPTWTGADRAASARAAVAAGAGVLVMDDGLQNPGLQQDAGLLVIDGAVGFGNGHLLPAGPLREPVARAASRCVAAVLIGEDQTGALAALPAGLPVLRAAMVPGPAMAAMAGRRVVAFAGIGRPGKFFATLRQAGIEVAAEAAFADHYLYSSKELDRLRRQAEGLGAALVTTTKDHARLDASLRTAVVALDVRLAWENELVLEVFLLQPGAWGSGFAPPSGEARPGVRGSGAEPQLSP